jgi:hypothetical protein
MKNFFRTIANRENSSCSMIYPLFKTDSVLFDKNDDKSKKFLSTCIELSKNGFQIYIIFIINHEFQITKYFKKSIYSLIDNKINIKIAFIEEIIELKISSYDFIYSKEKDVAIYTSLRDRIRMFKVTKTKEKIQNLVSDYEKIDDISFSFNELEDKKEFIKDKYLKQLIGSWHLYFYSSIKENSKHILWHNEIEIYKNSTIKYYHNKELLLEGKIDTSFNKEKVFCYLNHLTIDVLSIITFKKRHISKNIFKVMITDSQVINDYYDMASFGIFSRKELDETLVKKALGDTDEVMLRESIDLEKRINELYIKSRF